MISLTPQMFLIICPFSFLAGFIDSIAGGGGLIALPAFLIAGIPAHTSIATNKLASAMGTSVAVGRFAKEKLINWKIAVPSIFAAFLGSALGANISLLIDEKIIENLLLIVLPTVAFLVLNKKWFHDNPEEEEITKDRLFKSVIAVFLIGIYDGVYGPGTGTFLIIVFTIIGKLSMAKANGTCKLLNLCTSVSAMLVYLQSGKINFPLGFAAAASGMLGNYLGSSMVMTRGSRIVRPIILGVLGLFLLKLLIGLF